MADVSLDDLIKQDKSKGKVNRTHIKVFTLPFRNLSTKSLATNPDSMTNKIIVQLDNKKITDPSNKNSSKKNTKANASKEDKRKNPKKRDNQDKKNPRKYLEKKKESRRANKKRDRFELLK